MARLRLSVGARTYGDRPMTPVEVAFAIKEFAKETGNTQDSIAKRLGVSVDTCRMFLAILDLPRDWWNIWYFGQVDSRELLPFSMASKLGPKFKSGKLTKNDLDLLKGAALDTQKHARRGDIVSILSYKTKNPKKTMQECTKSIMNMTLEKISSYVIITDIDLKFVKDSSESAEKRILKMLETYFLKGSIEDLRIKNDSHLMLLLNKDGYNRFYDLAKKRKVASKEPDQLSVLPSDVIVHMDECKVLEYTDIKQTVWFFCENIHFANK